MKQLAIEQNTKNVSWPRLGEIPFDVSSKMMTVFNIHENKFIVFTKGAPNILLNSCIDVVAALLHEKVNLIASKGHH